MNKIKQSVRLAIGFISLMAFSFAFSADNASDVTISALHTRTLAASCAACHGHLGNPVELANTEKSLQLAGVEKQTIIERLQNFRSGKTESTVMHHHAKGLSEAEITALAEFFSTQQKKVKSPLSTQPYQMPAAESGARDEK
jgi:cytochrome c553